MPDHHALLSFLRERATDVIVTPECYDFSLDLADLYAIPGRVDFRDPMNSGMAFSLAVMPRDAYPFVRAMEPRIPGTQYQLKVFESALELHWMVPCPVIPKGLRLTRTLFRPVFGIALEVAWDLYREFEKPSIH